MKESFYTEIFEILNQARYRAYRSVNFAMVEAYWNIGRQIIAEQGGAERAEYGAQLIQELSKRLTADFGKGFTPANLKNMRQFYLSFPKSYALRSELTWTHYRMLMRVENEIARQFYLEECVKANWSTRQLERQINSFFMNGCCPAEIGKASALKLQCLSRRAVRRDPGCRMYCGVPCGPQDSQLSDVRRRDGSRLGFPGSLDLRRTVIKELDNRSHHERKF